MPAIAARGSDLRVELDTVTGLPRGLSLGTPGSAVCLALAIELVTGGREVAGVKGGLAYAETNRQRVERLVPGSLEHTTSGPREEFSFEAEAGDWRVRMRIGFALEAPRIDLHVAATPYDGAKDHVLRDLFVRADLSGSDLPAWRVEAPGNLIRPGVGVGELRGAVAIKTAGDDLGSPGFVLFHRAERPLSLLLWPLSRSEWGEIEVQPLEGGVRWELRTGLAGALSPGEWIEHGPIHVDLVERGWDVLRGEVEDWYEAVGIATPREQVAWSATANLFEVMIGSAPFRGGSEYAPYPTMADLVADLDRIAGLGFDCLQLMPRHPYPSYNIHAPGDVATTYAPPDELRALVDACHARGIRLILDILLHGVLDHASIQRALDTVRNGPHADHLDDPCADPYAAASEEISWARHIVEFAPAWLAGAPERHPLLDEHPEWFMRDSGGAVTGVYTQALDTACDAWQDHFVAGCVGMVEQLGIDGFRVDAPLYNQHANWSEATRRHASYSNLGAVRLLRKLRRRLRAISPELLVYTEPSGPLVRPALDLAYAYEEKWLVSGLYPPAGARDLDWRRIRNGRELAAWCRDFDASVPPGAVSAHFLDAHDTMWWRLPGDWWRRDEIGLDALKAMTAIFTLRGGAYLLYIGGEQGIEDELRRALHLRREVPELRDGSVDYDAVSVDDDAIYAVVRRLGERIALVAVNTSAADVLATCTLRAAVVPGELVDAWSDEPAVAPRPAPGGGAVLELGFAPYQARVLRLIGRASDCSRR